MSEETVISVFVRLRNRLLQSARRILPRMEDAEDALQETFVRLWQRADSLESQKDAEALATTTIRHLGVDALRAKQKNPKVPIEESCELKELADMEDECREQQLLLMEELLERILTPTQQKIVQLREYEGRSYAEVAQMMGMHEPAVRQQLSRARKAIRNEWRKRKH